jgi:hypothetical protein
MKDVAKKTLAKIEKEQTKLDSLTAKRDELTATYQAKLAELNEDIKEQEKTLAVLRGQEKAEKLEAVASILGQSGASVDDLLVAVANGDLYAIQEMIEAKGKPAPETVTDTSDDTDNDNSSDNAFTALTSQVTD